MKEVAFSLRSWDFEKPEQPTVTALLDRVNRERGHFREIVESSLQEELVTEGALALSDSDDDISIEEASRTTQHGKPTSREDLFRAKYEMLEKVSYAHNEIMMALDFVSLLSSKDTPAGRQTMSQYLRENVPAGTLGSDVWKRTALDATQETRNAELARNVRLEALEKSADDVLAAARTLESNVKAEVQYWNQVNAITTKGWSLCRLPGQQHKLGVRFGFSESATRFSQGGIAALELDDDGDITLASSVRARTQAVRVSIMRDSVVTGRSSTITVPELDIEALESRIRYARDSLFDEELFYEMERETRLLPALGVRTRGSVISFPLQDSPSSSVQFELHNAKAASGLEDGLDITDNTLAQKLLYSARLLLCRAHRDALQQRSQIPPPISDQAVERPALDILRPIMSFLAFTGAVSRINDRIRKLTTLLKSAKIQHKTVQAAMTLPKLDPSKTTEGLMSFLLESWSCSASVQLVDGGLATPFGLTVTIHKFMLDDSEPAFRVCIADKSVLELPTYKQASTALDRQSARMVAMSLAGQKQGDWKVDELTADLYHNATMTSHKSKRREACVLLDTASSVPALKLVWTDGSHEWTADSQNRPTFDEIWTKVSTNA